LKLIDKLKKSIVVLMCLQWSVTLFLFMIVITQHNDIKRLKSTQVIEYHVDNYDGRYNYYGYVINKTSENNTYTLEVVGYGMFNVSEVEYYEVQIGQKLPKHIMDRGVNNESRVK